jgi:hypothetical protein
MSDVAASEQVLYQPTLAMTLVVSTSSCRAKARHPRLSLVKNSKVVDGGPSATTTNERCSESQWLCRLVLYQSPKPLTHIGY